MRLQNWGENLALYSAGWVGLIAGIAYLVTKIRGEGWGVLLCLDGDVWGMAALVAIIAGVVVWLPVTLAAGIIQPRLPSIFPGRYSWPGAEVTTGVRENGRIIIEEVGFSNPDYAAKFCKANGLKRSF